MRRRLLGALVGVALLTLVVYAVPRSFMVADLVMAAAYLKVAYGLPTASKPAGADG